MPARPFLIVRTGDQWLRSSHAGTSLDVEQGIVQLGDARDEAVKAGGDPRNPAGLAFDRECRLYRGCADHQHISIFL